MNEDELTQEEIDEYNERINKEYQEETKANEEIRKKQEQGRQLEIPGLDQQLRGTAFEIGANLALDAGTSWLLGVPEGFLTKGLYGIANVGGSAIINAIAQKMRGDKFSLGELVGTSAASLIPGAVTGKGVARSALRGATTAGVEQNIRSIVDDDKVLGFGDQVSAFATGGVLGTGFDFAGKGISKTQFFQGLAEKMNKGKSALYTDISYAAMSDNSLMKTTGGSVNIPPPRQGAKQLLTKLPKGASFDTDEVNDYVTRALVHREGRVMQGGKQNLMKGFDETISNKSGQPYILVKKSKKVVSDDAAIENYDLRKVADVELDAAARLGFDYQVGNQTKYLKTIVAELNKNPEIAQNPKLYLSTLMEYGDKAYLEHKVARRMAIPFWQRVEARRAEDIQNNLFQWTGATNRNDEKNIRLLLDPNYKTLKDTTEKRLDTILKNNNLKTDDAEAFVITIEDPNDAVFSANSLFVRSNPGNIQIRKAGTGEVVGAIPDFYRQIYSTQFKTAFGKTKALQGPSVPKQIRALPGETIDNYRKRIINKMLDDAVSGKTSMLGFEERYLQELNDFYNTFEQLQESTGLEWVRKPSWVQEIQTGKNNFADAAEADIQDFNIRDQAGNVIELDVDSRAELKELAELEDIVRNMPREQTGRYSGSVLTSLRGERRRIMKDIDRIRRKYNLGKYRYRQQELNI